MLDCSHQAFSQWIVVQIVDLRLPETLRLDLHRVSRWLPQPPIAISAGALRQHVLKAVRHVFRAEIRESAAYELAEVRYGLLQRLGLKVRVEENGVQMRWHNNVGIDSRTLWT